MNDLVKLDFDVVVVGAGGSGLRAVMGSAEANLKQLVSQKFFQQEVIQLQHREELVQHLEIWEVMIGLGICMTR